MSVACEIRPYSDIQFTLEHTLIDNFIGHTHLFVNFQEKSKFNSILCGSKVSTKNQVRSVKTSNKIFKNQKKGWNISGYSLLFGILPSYFAIKLVKPSKKGNFRFRFVCKVWNNEVKLSSFVLDMGNNIMSGVMKVFDRNHLEIESISARIDRERMNGCREKHEVYVENIGIFLPNMVKCVENRMGSYHQIQVLN